MPNPDDYQPPNAAAAAAAINSSPMASSGIHLPLLNLSLVQSRMDYVQRFLSDSINTKTVIPQHQMDMVSKEITDAIHQVIVNGAALISSSKPAPAAGNPSFSSSLTFKGPSDQGLNDTVDLGLPKVEAADEEIRDDWNIVELDAVELLAEHLHFCDFCGKGFKRDANLRMHMRAHGNRFKTPEALAKPEKSAAESTRITRFSCPFSGCNRNKLHKKFRPLKSVICVKNHFKRSHCPKMYSCNRCNKKNFSVLADLKSHLKHCGETKWKCSCGTSFSRKDKLFGHMALFDGHMPAVAEDDEKQKEVAPAVEVEDDKGMELEQNGFFDGLLDDFGSIDDYSIQDLLDSSPEGVISWNL